MKRSWPVLFLLLGAVPAFVACRPSSGSPAAERAATANQLSSDDAARLNERFPTAQATPSGLRYIVRTPGEGPTPVLGQRITAHYHGTLLASGQKFDSSYDRNQPFTFQLGLGQVIKGWDEAFAAMKRGEKRTLIVPWWLAYGAAGRPPTIPPRASLVFEVELLDFH